MKEQQSIHSWQVTKEVLQQAQQIREDARQVAEQSRAERERSKKLMQEVRLSLPGTVCEQ